ncbi:MAG: signal peptide peptidase SppA [Acidobacteria bacterium]|nr:signal peptide peptidase SppA [Acidobacteriota bacterium]
MALSRGARLILTFVLAAALVSMLGLAAALLVAGRGPTVERDSVLWLRLPPTLAERSPDDLVGQFFGGRETVGSIVAALRKAKADERIAAVVLVPSVQPGLWGKVQEIRDAVLDFRESDKPIVAYLEFGQGQAYYLATACDEIFLTPSSPLNLVGVASYELFLRGAFDKVGIEADMLAAGDYKTASNLYTETTFTPEHREMAASLNRDFFEQLVDGIADGREMDPAVVRAIIDEGPFLPQDALRRGLIDAVVYEDQLLDGLPIPRNAGVVDFARYRQVRPAGVGIGGGPSLGVVFTEGTINFGASGAAVTGGRTVGSETWVRALREARDDPGIAAIILRIDSPGGVAVAADIMWREVVLARARKPVIASMSDLAASGGYYIAAPAHAIVAQPGTLTGSIGAFGGKFVLGGALDRFGVNVEAVSDGAQADLFSPATPFSDASRRALQRQLDATYERFLQIVAEGRGMTRDEVHAVAQGRVWTGRQAKARGLVDELGGLRRAVELAKEQAGIDPEREVTLVPFPRRRSVWEQLQQSVSLASAAAWLTSPAVRGAAALLGPTELLASGAPLLLLPRPAPR